MFRDVDTIGPGQDFVQAIESRLAACQVMLVVIGREWVDARSPSGTRRLDDPHDFVRLEVAAGLARAGVLVVPVLVEEASMPSAAHLPDNMRSLARLQAVSLRDETWDTDVDRLVAVIASRTRKGRGEALRLARAVRPVPLALAAIAFVALATLGIWLTRPRSAGEGPAVDRAESAGAVDVAGRAGASASASVSATAGAATAPYTIDVPRVAEVAFQDLVVMLVSGNVFHREGVDELRLRMRMSNRGSTPVNFWDQGFRLVANQDTIPATGGLDEVVPGHTLTYGVISFRTPPGARTAVLRLLHGEAVVDVPIDISATGRPPVDEQAPIEDSLSQAIARRVVSAPTPLLDTPDLTATIVRATSRRFVNTLRVTLSLRIGNRSRYPVNSGALAVRAVVEGATIAPRGAPNQVIEGASTGSEDIVFDLPPTASHVAVTTAIGARSSTIDLMLD